MVSGLYMFPVYNCVSDLFVIYRLVDRFVSTSGVKFRVGVGKNVHTGTVQER